MSNIFDQVSESPKGDIFDQVSESSKGDIFDTISVQPTTTKAPDAGLGPPSSTEEKPKYPLDQKLKDYYTAINSMQYSPEQIDISNLPETEQRAISAIMATGREFVEGAFLNAFDIYDALPGLKEIATKFNQNIPIKENDPIWDKLAKSIQNDPAIAAKIPARMLGYLLSIGKISRTVAAIKGIPTTVKELMTQAGITGGIAGFLTKPSEEAGSALEEVGIRGKQALTNAAFFSVTTGTLAGITKAVDWWRAGKPKALAALREEMYKTLIDKRGLPRTPETVGWTDSLLDDLANESGGFQNMSRFKIGAAIKRVKELSKVLFEKMPDPTVAPGVSIYKMEPLKLLKNEAGSIPLNLLVPGSDTIESVGIDMQRTAGALSRAFTRFKELDASTRQAFINLSNSDSDIWDTAIANTAKVFKDVPPESWEGIYNHLQEPKKYPLPEGSEDITKALLDISKWSFKTINRLGLTSQKNIEALDNAIDNDLPIPNNLKPKLKVPHFPENQIEAADTEKRILEFKLKNINESIQDAVKDDKAVKGMQETKLELEAKLGEVNKKLDALHDVRYFHQISTPKTLKAKGRIIGSKLTKVISAKPKGLLGRSFVTREEAQKAGYATSDLPTATAHVIYETNKAVYMDQFIKNINRNSDFSQRADLAPNDWVRMDERIFPSGKYRKYHPAIADALKDVTYVSDKHILTRMYDKANATMKVIGFYNPIFMTRYNISQGIRAAGLKSLLEYPEAIKIWAEKGETYKMLRRNDLFNNVFNLKPTMDDISKQLLAQINGSDAPADFKEIAKTVLNPFKLAHKTWKLLNEGTWKIDEFQRIATWLAVKDDPRWTKHYSDFEIIELVNDFHANYGKVPKQTREILNRAIFTPTYKVSMARILGRMHREPKALWPSLLRHYAMKVAFNKYVPIALTGYFAFKKTGKKARVEGYRLIISDPKDRREKVYSISDPSLEEAKLTNRPLKRTVEYNLAAMPSILINTLRGPLFNDRNIPGWANRMNALFKTGAPVVKEWLTWETEDKDTFDKFMSGVGLAFIYERNKKELEPFKDHIATQVLKSINLYIDRKTLFPEEREKRYYYVKKKPVQRVRP